MNPENEQKSNLKKMTISRTEKDVVETNPMIFFLRQSGSVGWGLMDGGWLMYAWLMYAWSMRSWIC